MSLDTVERVELYEYTFAKTNLVRSINTTNLKDLLITANRTDMNPFDWKRLDSALVALRSRMGTKPLNFYLTFKDGESSPEGWKPEFLPIFTKDRGVSIDKSLVETSMECKGSGLKTVRERREEVFDRHV